MVMIAKAFIATLILANMIFVIEIVENTKEDYASFIESRYQKGDTAISITQRGRL